VFRGTLLIFGRGLMGESLNKLRHGNVILFASGVSNSQEQNASEFEREKNLLIKTLEDTDKSLFYYISTCSIFDISLAESAYVIHKKLMEEIVLSKPTGRVIRLPNIVGPSGNPANLVNYLKYSIKSANPIKIQSHATRYLLGVDEMNLLLQDVVDNAGEQKVISLVPPENIKVTKIVYIIESILGTQANLYLVEGGTPYEVDFSDTKYHASRLGFDFGQMYYENTLEKWCKLED
jgi:nucleoside-diphosphate-sugar epimerase